MEETDQLNVEIPSSTIKEAKKDCLELGASLKAYVTEAIIHFKKSLPIAQRRARFSERSTKKLTGRPVST